MGFSEQLGDIYAGIEEKFYAGLDFISNAGVPVYAVIDPLEEKGIPALPVTFGAILLIIFLLYGMIFLPAQGVTLKLSLKDNYGASLNGVTIAVTGESGKTIDLGSDSFRDNQQVEIPRGIGSKIILTASKNGFESADRTVTFKTNFEVAAITLKKQVSQIEASIRLVDSDTDDPIENAQIVANFSAGEITCLEQGNGLYLCPGVIEGEDTQLIITQPNYEQSEQTAAFFSEQINPISLTAKASAAKGKSNLIVRVFDSETKQKLGNFSLKIYDAKNNELITEATETDGDAEYIEKISKGTSVRILVEHENYLSYDSGVLGANFTLREDEEKIEAYLKPGTNALKVSVFDITGRPLEGIPVLLFNEGGDQIKNATTNLAGEVSFEGLSTETAYFVSAWNDKFVPARKIVNLGEKNTVSLVLERAIASNSGSLTVYAADEKSNALNDVTLNFFENSEQYGVIPLGVPAQKTDTSGKFTILAPLNKKIVVRATKGNLVGESEADILNTFKNEVFVELREPFSQVLLTVNGADGKEVKGGFVSIYAGNDLLYENAYQEGGIIFNPKGNEYVIVEYTDAEGNSFGEEIYAKEVESITLNPKGGKGGATTNPEVEYIGVFNIDGSEADGLSKGIDYFLKFRVAFPEGNSDNGFHVRLGPDDIQFADSMDAGIIGFSSSGASSFYGRTYSSQPAPGFEALDFENSGKEGSYNKFLELYFKNGGEKIIKVRVKAKETATDSEIELNYRAWSNIAGTIFRTPEDSELGTSVFSDSRTSLYAETKKDKLKLLEPSASCENDLCASYRFLRSDGSEFTVDNFKAVIGEIYAIDVSIAPDVAGEVTVKASTSKQIPKIGFQGFSVNESNDFPDLDKQDTSIQVDNLTVKAGETASVRLFFKTLKKENSFITVQLISGETVINDQFYFDIYNEQNLTLKTIPENVVFGEDFIIQLNDESNNGIPNAQIILSDEAGEHLETIVGSGEVNAGGAGRYLIKNSFSAGKIKYEVRAEKFRSLNGTIDITKTGLISWAEDETIMVIQKGNQSIERFVDLVNNSKQNIQELSFEVDPITLLPDGVQISVTPLSNLPANSTQRIVFVAEYSGQRDTAHAEARIIAKGRTETGFSVIAETKAIVDYNPKIKSECVDFSKKKLVVYIASGYDEKANYNSSFGQGTSGLPNNYYRYDEFKTNSDSSFTATLAQKPECSQLELELVPEIASKGRNNEGLEISSDTIVLAPELTDAEGRRKDTSEVTISVTNKIIRNYPGKQRFNFDVVYKSKNSDFQKSIPVEVYVWNPRYALQVSRNIELFLGPDDRGRFAAQVPLFVRNVGEADIENIDFKRSSASSRGNVDITVDPPFAIQVLRKGQTINPPKTLKAQAIRNEKTTLIDIKELDITGVIDGTTFSFGPIVITSHISGDKCLIATPGNVAFYSTKPEGSNSAEISVRNTCAEQVRIRGVSKTSFGNNQLRLEPADTFIAPGAQTTMSLILTKNEHHQSSPTPVYVQGILPRSGNIIDSTPIIVDVKIGEYIKEGTAATSRITLDVCEGGTKDVRFPIVASGSSPSCDNAYCDSVQLSNYLVQRMESKVKDAGKQIQNSSGEVSKSFCSDRDLAKGFCGFDGLGISSEPFFVYFSHDNLSPQILEKALDKSNELKSFRADFFEGDFGGEYLGLQGKQIFMNGNFQGCGRYQVVLNGSVKINGSRIEPDLMNIVIDVTPEEGSVRQETEQCLPRIQNMSNFLPTDEGLLTNELTQEYQAWPGVVAPGDKALDDVAKDAAKTLFGSENRLAANSAGTNQLRLQLGNDPGYIVKVEMDKVPSNTPYSITAYIKESIGADSKLKGEIAKEAAQAIKELKENVIDGCIGEDESYFLLKNAGEIGTLDAFVESPIQLQYKESQCSLVTVSSDIIDDVSLAARKFDDYDGLSKGSPYFKEYIGKDKEPGSKTNSLEVSEINSKTNRFEGMAYVCVEGNENLHLAQDKKIIVSVQKQFTEGGKPFEKEASLAVCGIHPIDLLAKLRSDTIKDGETYYATLMWKGDPDSISISELEKMVLAQQTIGDADEILKNGRDIKKEDPEPVKDAKQVAANWYLGACALTTTATSLARPIVGWGAWLFNVVFDCGLPYAAIISENVPILSDIKSFFTEFLWGPIKEGFNTVTTGFGSIIKSLFYATGIADKPGGGEVSIDESLDAINKVDFEEVPNNIIDAYADVSLISDAVLARTETLSTRKVNLSQVGILSDNIMDEIVKKFEAQGIKDPTFVAKLKSNTPKIKEALKDAMKEKSRAAGQTLSTDEFKTVMKKTAGEIGGDKELLKIFGNARSGITGAAFEKGSVVDKVTETLSEKTGIKKISVRDSPSIPATGTTRANKLAAVTDELAKQAAQRFRTNLELPPFTAGGGIATDPLIDLAKQNVLLSTVEIETVFQPAAKIKGRISKKQVVAKEAQEAALETMEKNLSTVIKESADSSLAAGAHSLDTATVEALNKKASSEFSKLSGEKVAAIAAEEIKIKDIKPKFFSWEGLRTFGVNFLKEGAFGLLSNWVGLKAYDWSFKREIKKATKQTNIASREEELKAAQIDFLGVGFDTSEGTGKDLLKYRTYSLEVKTDSVGALVTTFGLAKTIPKDTDKEHLLNVCDAKEFNKEMNNYLPGLIPKIDNESDIPEPLRKTSALRAQHIRIAKSYLEPGPNGEAVGAIVAAAAESKKVEFETTGINLEALVISVGIMKSALGNDEKTAEAKRRIKMFGCNFTNVGQSDIHSNAVCAINKLDSYRAGCGSNAACYFNSYNSDTKNQQTNIYNMNDSEFNQLYEKWASYEFRAA